MEPKVSLALDTYKELYRRESRSRITGEVTTLRILSGPGGRYYYDEEIMKKDRLIYIELINNGHAIRFPFSVRDQEKMWELVFDVWQKPEKITNYVERFRRLINSKLAQRKLPDMAQAYSKETRQLQ